MNWPELLRRPDHLAGDDLEEWFTRIAAVLLNGSRLMAGGSAHRFVEIEFYYYSAAHPDPAAHREPIQLECGRWYFHRTAGVYRGGSFKGLDLTFGDGTAFGGVLIRAIERLDGTLIEGPSLSVDYLLDGTGMATVAELDRAIGMRVGWDAGNPLRLEVLPEPDARPVYRCGRVGLAVKKGKAAADSFRYLLRPYRFLTTPQRISKGKAYLVLALHAQGMPPETIRQLTNCPTATIQRYIADFEEGRQVNDFRTYVGQDLNPKTLCRLHGTWYAHFGGHPTGG